MNAHQMHALCAGILNSAHDLNALAIEETNPEVRAFLFVASKQQQDLMKSVTDLPLSATTEKDPFRPTTHRVSKGTKP